MAKQLRRIARVRSVGQPWLGYVRQERKDVEGKVTGQQKTIPVICGRSKYQTLKGALEGAGGPTRRLAALLSWRAR